MGDLEAHLSVPMDEILRALRNYPDGVTTAHLATRLSLKPASLGNRLGKIWMYGGPVERKFGQRVNGAHAQSIWSPR